jgi:DoxX-like family
VPTLDRTSAQAVPVSKTKQRAGRVVSGLVLAFLLLDGGMKIVKGRPAVEGSAQLGYSESLLPAIGVLLLGCTLLYVIPRTSVVRAILLTGYLGGGALASQLRVGNPLFSHVLFPVYFAVLVWGGLFLRDRRVGALIAPGD